METNLFQTFIKHRRYLKNAGVVMEYVEGDNSPYIYLNNPLIISSFAGFVKNRVHSDIFFRGEANNYPHIIPSLFRDTGKPLTDNTVIRKRWKAYNELKKFAIKQLNRRVSRFRNEDVDNFFQHYGIKSPVIDLVDNIYVAIWFALQSNKEPLGYIRMMNTSSSQLTVSDLRKNHSSLSLRLHTQHGLIAKKKVRSWNKSNIYYDDFEIARIKFPIKKNVLGGKLFSRQNFFPDQTLDNTLKIIVVDIGLV